MADLIKHIKAPDFPTGGIIYGYEGVKEAYETGRGRVMMRAKTEIEHTATGRECIVVTEIPYMVNKAEMIRKIADLINEKKIEGIAYINDESDRNGMRIVMILKTRCGCQRRAEQPVQVHGSADVVPGQQHRAGRRTADVAEPARFDPLFCRAPARCGGAPYDVTTWRRPKNGPTFWKVC